MDRYEESQDVDITILPENEQPRHTSDCSDILPNFQLLDGRGAVQNSTDSTDRTIEGFVALKITYDHVFRKQREKTRLLQQKNQQLATEIQLLKKERKDSRYHSAVEQNVNNLEGLTKWWSDQEPGPNLKDDNCTPNEASLSVNTFLPSSATLQKLVSYYQLMNLIKCHRSESGVNRKDKLEREKSQDEDMYGPEGTLGEEEFSPYNLKRLCMKLKKLQEFPAKYQSMMEHISTSLGSSSVADSKIVPEKESVVSSGRLDLASKKAPRFTWNPGDQIVDEGKPFTLTVEVEGEPLPTVAWTKDGERLGDDFYRFKQDGDTHSLIIDDVLPEDEGTYIATATNPVGRAECTIQITVNEGGSSPHFTKPLQDVEAIEGQRLQLQCLLTGDPTPSVQWYKDGKSIDTHPDYEITRDKQGVCMLDIEEIFMDDAGRFTCRAKNEFGRAETASKITVTSLDADRPPTFVSNLHLATPLQEGQPCRLEAQVSAKPPPTVSWYKDGKVIRTKPRYKTSLVKDVASLDIPNVLPEDAGVYECVASNPAGATKSKVELKVPAYDKAPEFATKPQPAEPPKQGRPCHIECQISAKPAPTVSWYKDGKPIQDGRKYRTSYVKGIACLDISDVVPEDAGVYECVATNPLGTATSTVEVMVPGLPKPPEFVSKMQVAEPLLEGRPFHIECPVTAQPSPTITWYKDGKPLGNQPRYRTSFVKGVACLDIDNVVPEDAGVYECVATNPSGTAASTVEVMVPDDTVSTSTCISAQSGLTTGGRSSCFVGIHNIKLPPTNLSKQALQGSDDSINQPVMYYEESPVTRNDIEVSHRQDGNNTYPLLTEGSLSFEQACGPPTHVDVIKINKESSVPDLYCGKSCSSVPSVNSTPDEVKCIDEKENECEEDIIGEHECVAVPQVLISKQLHPATHENTEIKNSQGSECTLLHKKSPYMPGSDSVHDQLVTAHSSLHFGAEGVPKVECPVCLQNFPTDTSEETLTTHVNLHFDEQLKTSHSFEILNNQSLH